MSCPEGRNICVIRHNRIHRSCGSKLFQLTVPRVQKIAYAKTGGDRYLFSKSVKKLPAKEKEWVLLEHGFKEYKDEKGDILYRHKSCIDKFPYTVELNGKNVTVQLTEKRLLTYNPKLATKKRYEINRMVEKAKALTLSQAKKDDYGDIFTGESTVAKLSTVVNSVKHFETVANGARVEHLILLAHSQVGFLYARGICYSLQTS